MSLCSIPVSIGELWDKYTILNIKKRKIKSEERLACVNKEIDALKPYIEKYPLETRLINELTEINTSLWNLEDHIRELDNKNIFNEEFIKVSRSIYYSNDKRHEVKNKIDLFHNSYIVEVKSYKEHKATQ